MNIYIPFTYRVTSKTTGQHYYGVRFGKEAHPDTLWTTYFTSSEPVKELIEKHGKDDFVVEVRKTFKTRKEAQDWEMRVLQRLNVIHRDDWLNIHIMGHWVHTEETIRKISESHKGRKKTPEHIARQAASLRGKKRTAETRRKMSLSHTGLKHSEETKAKQRAAGLKRVFTPEQIAILKANGRLKPSDATRQKMRASSRKRWDKWRATK